MDAPLQDCTIEEQRGGVVQFLWAGVKPVEIDRRMLAQYGQSTMSQRKVYEWVERFESGRTRVTCRARRLSSRQATHIFCSYVLRNRVRLCVDRVTHHQK